MASMKPQNYIIYIEQYKVPSFFFGILVVVCMFFFSYQPVPSYPTYYLTIAPQHQVMMDASLPPLNMAFLAKENRVWVPAEFMISDGMRYDVEVRYRGNFENHWRHSKKSYAIRFDGDSPFQMESVNFVLPNDKGYVLEHFNLLRARHFGLKTMDNTFASLSINGSPAKVYWLSAKFDKSFLARNQLPKNFDLISEGDHVYSSTYKLKSRVYEGKVLTVNAQFLLTNLLNSVAYFEKKVSFDYFTFDDFSHLYLALNVIRNAITTDDIFKIFDRDNLLAMNAVYRLVGSRHFENNDNWVLYFDYSVGKFFFIPWDILDNYDVSHMLFVEGEHNFGLYLGNWLFYVLNLDQDFRTDLAVLLEEYESMYFADDYQILKKLSKEFYRNYKNEEPKYGLFSQMFLNAQEFKELLAHLSQRDKALVSHALDTREELSSLPSHFPDVTVDNFAEKYPFVEEKADRFIIDGDVVLDGEHFLIPPGVHVEVSPGVTFSLGDHVNIVVLGVLDFLGTSQNRIVLKPAGDAPWGYVMYLNPSSTGSHVEYVDFVRGGDGVFRYTLPEFYVTSQLSALFTDIEARGNRFIDTQYDDLAVSYRKNINIVKHYDVDDTLIGFEISPDTFYPIRIIDISIDGDYDALISPDQEFVASSQLGDRVLVPRGLTQFTDLNDWYGGQEVPFGYRFDFVGSQVKYVDLEFEDMKLDVGVLHDVYPETEEYQIREVAVYDEVFAYFDRIDESVDMFLERYPDIFVTEKANILRVSKGVYEINEDIIIPQNMEVRIDPGVVFEMAETVSILSYSPVFASGTQADPIIFKGQVLPDSSSAAWGAFGVVGKEASSVFEHVFFDGGGDDYINGVYMPM